MEEFTLQLVEFRCPRWIEFPEVDLYMDQVISIIESRFGFFVAGQDQKMMTSTMINNYVKQKVISAPIKKKYTRTHLASLFIICVVKRVLSIEETSIFLSRLLENDEIETAYSTFCDVLESALSYSCIASEAPFVGSDNQLLNATCLAFANKLISQKLITVKTKETKKAKK